MEKPSSTITAATLAGAGMTVVWELFLQFGIEPRTTLVSAGTTFAVMLAGYFWPERVLTERIETRVRSELAAASLLREGD